MITEDVQVNNSIGKEKTRKKNNIELLEGKRYGTRVGNVLRVVHEEKSIRKKSYINVQTTRHDTMGISHL